MADEGWMAQVHEASVERLRFEYETRQRAILILETRINALTDKYERLEREKDRLMASDQEDIALQYFEFIRSCDEQTEAAKAAAWTAEREMAEIYRVLSVKWC